MCEQLKRRRSAYCRGDSCRLLSLNYHDVEELRQMSGSIDRAVSKAISSLKKNRPNLFAEDGATADSASRHVHELDLKVSQLQEQMSADTAAMSKQMEELMAAMSQQMEELKQMLSAR